MKRKRDRYRVEVSYELPEKHSVGVVRVAARPAATVFIETLKVSDPSGRELARLVKRITRLAP